MRELFVVLVAAAGVFAWLAWPERSSSPSSAPGVTGLLGGPAEGMPRIHGPQPLAWPRDYGAHPVYRHEWWYFTGHLETSDGRRFGFQFTLFRFRLPGPVDATSSAWATDQIWMGHLALSDLGGERFHSDERVVRGALGLAGAEPDRWWIRDWRVQATETGWRLRASSRDFGLDLSLAPGKPAVLQGDAGYSRKGPEPGNASMYYSLTRMDAGGRLRLKGETRTVVDGSAWLDREWGTSALGEGLAGWDWFALQLDDGRDLMIYRLRTRQGGTAPWSAGKLVTADGTARTLSVGDFDLSILRTWRDDGGHAWPVAWRIAVPSADVALEVEAVFPGQLWAGRVRYWEGAVDIRDSASGRAAGRGYLEMTGYADSY